MRIPRLQAHYLNRWWILLLVTCAGIVVAGLFASIGTSTALADIEDTETVKAIAVAYDSSGSMSDGNNEDFSKRWCVAKYSLEVLASMMGKNDVLNIVPMTSLDGTNHSFEVHGDQSASARVAQVHNADLGSSATTDPNYAQIALDTVINTQADEKFLVITTDGKFDKQGDLEGIEVINQIIAKATSLGVKVIYLTMGNGVQDINKVSGAETISAKEDGDILSSMEQVAGKIYGREVLDAKSFNKATGAIDVDAPMGTIIVFAQGKDSSVGKLISEEGKAVMPDMASVKYCEEPYVRIPGEEFEEYNLRYHDKASVNENLMGVVGVYSEPLPAGHYTLESSSSDIEVYYKPHVDIELYLRDSSGKIIDVSKSSDSNVIVQGDYTATYKLKDPFTGKTLKSELLGEPEFSFSVKNGDRVVTSNGEEPITIPVGPHDISATAELAGHVRVTKQYGSVKIVNETQPLEIIIDNPNKSFDVNTFDAKDAEYIFTVSKPNGEALTQEEWGAVKVGATSDGELEWEVKKLDEVGKFEARPTYGSSTVEETSKQLMGIFQEFRIPQREFPTTFSAVIQDDYNPYSGAINKDVVVYTPLMDWLPRILLALAILTLAIWVTWFFGTWPKLPKRLVPRLVCEDDESVNFKFFVQKKGRRGKRTRFELRKKQGKRLPYRTQTMSFGPNLRGTMEKYVNCTMFEIEAISKAGGVRRFRLTDATVDNLKGLGEVQGVGKDYLPKPEWNCEKDGYGYTLDSEELFATGRSLGNVRRRHRGTYTYVVMFK